MTSVVFETGAARTKQATRRDDDVDMARDLALITRAQDGDRSAFDELYLHYFRRLYRLCLRRLSDPHEAEDVAQEAFVRAWRALPRFCGERRFYPWLSVIAANLCTDVLRKRSRSTPVAEFYGADPDTGEELDARLVNEVDAAMVHEALTHLTERHRRILGLREGSGLSYQAIAEHEGVEVSAVETLLWRARQALKREFYALAEAAEGKGAVLAGAGLLGRFLSHVLRAPGRVARRVVHLTPASAVVTVASLSAVGALAVGSAHVAAPDPAPSVATATGLATHAIAAPTGPGDAAAGAPVGPAALGFLGFGAPAGGATANTPDFPGTSAGVRPGTDGGAPGAATGGTGGSGGVGGDSGSGVTGGHSASGANGAGLGGLLGTIASGSSGSGVLGSAGSTLNSVTKGVTGATGANGSVGSTVNTVTKGVSNAAGSLGATLNSVTKGVTGAVGAAGSAGSTVDSVTQGVSNAAGSVGATVNRVTKGVTSATGPVGTAASSATGLLGATLGSASPVLGGAASAPPPPPSSPAKPTTPSGGGLTLPIGIGGLFG